MLFISSAFPSSKHFRFLKPQLITISQSVKLIVFLQIVDVNVTLSAPKVIIPESGKLEENGPLIVADLGRLVLTTEVRSEVVLVNSFRFSLPNLDQINYLQQTNYRFKKTIINCSS